MNQTIVERKKSLRKQLLTQRDAMPRDERKDNSEKICTQLWDIIVEKKVKTIHSYLTMGSEVDILPVLQKALNAGITIAVPKTLRKRQMQNLILTDLENMEAGVFGTYHPKDAEEYTGKYDLIIVAGLAFDQENYRLGYGGGYYDTFLTEYLSALKIGVCFPFQIVEKVPREVHDVQLNQVVS